MDPEKAALLNFVGAVFGQSKELDQHIAAAGGAQFGERSGAIQDLFKTIATSAPVGAAMVPSPSPAHINPEPEPKQIESAPVQHVPIVHESEPKDVQLEFNFSQSQKDKLDDIFNILYDIRKLLKDYISSQAEKEDKEDKEESQKYVKCSLCGSHPKVKRKPGEVHLVCSSCSNSEVDKDLKTVRAKWNSKNMQV